MNEGRRQMVTTREYFWNSSRGKRVLEHFISKRTYKTISGLTVRSKSEARIANYLSKHNLQFEYEKEIEIFGNKYRPDFYLPKYNIYIEFFGLSHIPSYKEKCDEKKSSYAKAKIICIYLYHKGSKNLEWILEKELTKNRIIVTK